VFPRCQRIAARLRGLEGDSPGRDEQEENEVMSRHSLLLSFAHPDDESVLAAGVACKYGGEQVRVALVCATRGESGKAGEPPVTTRDELPAVREAELREAAAIAGITEVHLLGYRDRELPSAPPEEIRKRMVTVIRQHRPEVVITFDPNGSNLHPDHVAISRFTSDAISAASDPRWFPNDGEPHQVKRLLWSPPERPWEIARLPDLKVVPGADFVIDVSAWTDRKARALRAHRTQHLSIDRIFFSKPDVVHLLGVEVFRQAWGPPIGSRPLLDLFDGI
jgi:N-acetylglucosamine malate deacetylase 2